MEVKPFKAIRYNQNKVPLDKVVAPPYDVINRDRQLMLYDLHPNNIIRLILGLGFENDNEKENKYRRAAHFFDSWLKEGILVEDGEPSIYVYEQDFAVDGTRRRRLGFLALTKLQDIGSGLVFPHEKTMLEPKLDRLNLIRATGANLSPIFTLYVDDKHLIDKVLRDTARRKPLISIVDDRGIKDIVWQVSNQNQINTIISEMKNKELFIADGHHRYETALAFRDEQKKSNPNHSGKELYNYVLMYLVDMDDPGLVILPAHRVVEAAIGQKEFFKKLALYFTVEESPDIETLLACMNQYNFKHLLGLYLKKQFYLLDFKLSDGYFDVEVLHRYVLNEILGIDNSKVEKQVAFTKDAKEAIRLTDSLRNKMAFFLNPTPIEALKKVARARKTMPQKSTYFFPKPLCGLVISSLSS